MNQAKNITIGMAILLFFLFQGHASENSIVNFGAAEGKLSTAAIQKAIENLKLWLNWLNKK